MKKNVGKIDKVVRVLLAVALIAAAIAIPLTGVWFYVAIAFAVVFLVTTVVGFCPLYSIFGCSTTCAPKTNDAKK